MIKFRGREQILAERHKTDMDRRETTFAFHTERTRGQIRFETVKDSASYSNDEETRDDKMLWSIVSNATERSKRQTRHF